MGFRTEGIPTYQHHSVLQQLHIPANEDERERQQLVRSIHSKWLKVHQVPYPLSYERD